MTYKIQKGRFIVFEGIDGCGKDTQIRRLCDYLWNADSGSHILITREPTKRSPSGIRTREMLASEADPYENAREFTELFVDDRIWHLREIVQPSINTGIDVICSRYILSTLAYQSVQGMALDELKEMHGSGFMSPDIGIVIDLDEDTALKRIAKDRGNREVFERKEFQRKLRDKYLKLASEYGYTVLDGSKSVEEVFQQIRTCLEALI